MVRILTDSTSDLDPLSAAALGVTVVPLRVMFGEESYRDGLDLTHEAFYARLAQSQALPTTSQPTPQDFLPYFQAAKEAGEPVVAILLSAALSGTVQSALIAKELAQAPEVYVVDSMSAIIGLRLLVEEAAALRDAGYSASHIAQEIEALRTRVVLFGIVDTLEYLHKGGRLSRAGMITGSLLHFKPIITLEAGQLKAVDKARGTGNAVARMVALMERRPPDPHKLIYFGYTANDETCQVMVEQVRQRYPRPQTPVCSVGSAIGTHVGPGAGAIAYLAENP